MRTVCRAVKFCTVRKLWYSGQAAGIAMAPANQMVKDSDHRSRTRAMWRLFSCNCGWIIYGNRSHRFTTTTVVETCRHSIILNNVSYITVSNAEGIWRWPKSNRHFMPSCSFATCHHFTESPTALQPFAGAWWPEITNGIEESHTSIAVRQHFNDRSER